MICEKKDSHNYKISSIMPMVHDFLIKQIYDDEKYQDYYGKRLQEIQDIIKDPITDCRVRGIYFEDFVTLRFQQSYTLKENIILKVQTTKYLTTLIQQKQLNYNVKSHIFGYIIVYFNFLDT